MFNFITTLSANALPLANNSLHEILPGKVLEKLFKIIDYQYGFHFGEVVTHLLSEC